MNQPTIIDLGFLEDSAAQKVRKALEGQTYMNFHVNIGICPGGPAVTIQTDYEAPFEEIAGMAMNVLASAL